MKRPVPKNMAHSIHQRLLNMAKATGRPFNELLQYYAMERFLYRLSISPHAGQFTLKGALMLVVWKVPLARTTLDIDLLARMSNRAGDVAEVIRAVCTHPAEPDGLTFDPDSVQSEPITEDADYAGIRTVVRGHLGNARISIQVDMGFSDVTVPEPMECEFPSLLELPAPRLRGYRRETTVAEKYEAMTKLGVLNSRMKDFYDIWLLGRNFDFDGSLLTEAVLRTFARRGTKIEARPVALTAAFCEDPAKQEMWSFFMRRMRLTDAPASLSEVVHAVTSLLEPVSEAITSGKVFRRTWRAPGPWQDITPSE